MQSLGFIAGKSAEVESMVRLIRKVVSQLAGRCSSGAEQGKALATKA